MQQITKIRSFDEGPFPINEELAGVVPMAIPSEQEALTLDIKERGQQQPVVIYKGAIVDGRCRQTALRAIHSFTTYVELDDSLTEEEVKLRVKSLNTRRNLTPTQKICVAARDYKRGNSKNVLETAASWGVTPTVMKNASFLLTNYEEVFNEMFNGRVVKIINKDGKEVFTDKITPVYKYYKQLHEKDNMKMQNITNIEKPKYTTDYGISNDTAITADMLMKTYNDNLDNLSRREAEASLKSTFEQLLNKIAYLESIPKTDITN